MRELLRLTDDLRSLDPAVWAEDPSWLDEVRYLLGPPVSADDLRTIVSDRLGTRRLPIGVAERVAAAVHRSLDPYRFAWKALGRAPTEEERVRAVDWTAGLIAVERLRTRRRNEEAREQEEAVKSLVESAGYERVPRPGQELQVLDELARMTFTDETKIAGTKADVIVRLFDGRLLAVECKASNSAVNSIKRLNREVGGKADQWRRAYGRQIVPCAVISGVFDVATLSKAQNEQGVFLVWQHDLSPLRAFVLPES